MKRNETLFPLRIGRVRTQGARSSEGQYARKRAGNRVRCRPAKSLAQRTGPFEGHLVEVRLACSVHQILVAGAELIDETELETAPSKPVLAGRHLLEVEFRAMGLHELLEEQVGVFQLLLELLPAPLGDFAEHAHRPLEFARG